MHRHLFAFIFLFEYSILLRTSNLEFSFDSKLRRLPLQTECLKTFKLKVLSSNTSCGPLAPHSEQIADMSIRIIHFWWHATGGVCRHDVCGLAAVMSGGGRMQILKIFLFRRRLEIAFYPSVWIILRIGERRSHYSFGALISNVPGPSFLGDRFDETWQIICTLYLPTGKLPANGLSAGTCKWRPLCSLFNSLQAFETMSARRILHESGRQLIVPQTLLIFAKKTFSLCLEEWKSFRSIAFEPPWASDKAHFSGRKSALYICKLLPQRPILLNSHVERCVWRCTVSDSKSVVSRMPENDEHHETLLSASYKTESFPVKQGRRLKLSNWSLESEVGVSLPKLTTDLQGLMLLT